MTPARLRPRGAMNVTKQEKQSDPQYSQVVLEQGVLPVLGEGRTSRSFIEIGKPHHRPSQKRLSVEIGGCAQAEIIGCFRTP